MGTSPTIFGNISTLSPNCRSPRRIASLLSQLAYARMPDNVPRHHENAETADGMIATVPIHTICCVPNAM